MPRQNDQRTDRMIGARIRQLRNERGLSQVELGKKIGVAFQQVQKYEKGSNAISSHRVGALCKALGITPDQLYRIDIANAQAPTQLTNYASRMALKLDRLTPPQKSVVTTLVNSFLDLRDGDNDE